MTIVAWAIVASTALHYLMNMYLSLHLVGGGWFRLIRALIPGCVLGTLTWMACWLINVLALIHPFPDALHFLLAMCGSLFFVMTAIFLFPKLLGYDDLNLLKHLPQGLTDFGVVKRLIRRL
jgi:hypothetical protein